MNLFVGCSASDGIPKEYFTDCKDFLDELFALEHNLVFGASGRGLMRVAYNVAINNFGDVYGIYPEVYKSEVENIYCFGIPTKTISERTDKMIECSDALIFLPGGFGTVYELFTSIEEARAHEINKPIVIYNSCGYFDKLFEFLELTYDEKFASRDVEEYYYVCNDAKDALEYIDRYYNKNCLSRKRGLGV